MVLVDPLLAPGDLSEAKGARCPMRNTLLVVVEPAWPPWMGTKPPVPPWLHAASVMVSARPRPTDAGITTSRAVLFRKLSMRCRTSCSFITHDHGTAFRVRRMFKSSRILGNTRRYACLWSVSPFYKLLPRIPQQHRDDASNVVTVCLSLSLINLLFSLRKDTFSPEIAL
jgi:hypothetical protein